MTAPSGPSGEGTTMTHTTYTDRSRVESFQRCNRLRFLQYHEAGVGLEPARQSLPLAVGLAVHKGLETLLRASMTTMSPETAEHDAVAAALADFATHRSALALDTAEEAARATSALGVSMTEQLAATAVDLGMSPDDPSLVALHDIQRNAAAEFDEWLWQEQAALCEGLVRAYARRRLLPLLEEFEVLEVEREGDWSLGLAWESLDLYEKNVHLGPTELRFMSQIGRAHV